MLSVRNPEEIRRGVAEAGPRFDAFLDHELARYGLGDGQLALVGFSQGTMLSLWTGPHRPGCIAGIVGYSGLIAWSLQREKNSAHKPPVLLVHGENDPVIPPIALPATRAALAGAGFPVETHLSPGLGHGIDASGLAAGGAFLQRVLSPAAKEMPSAAQ
jgi:phospholipase/carboxylesterase